MRHGAQVVICSRRLERVQEAARRLAQATGSACHGVVCDVRDGAACDAAVAAAVQAFGRLDILVNGAAGNFLAPACQLSSNGFKTVMDIDAGGTFNLSKAAHKYWSSLGPVAPGQAPWCILHISATLQYRGDPLQVHAAAAKAAVDSMARTMAREWGPDGVRVNCIAPGPIEGTEGMERLGGWMDGATRRQFLKRIPAQRMGQKEDIGWAALFLASAAASYITGVVLVVDGGMWMSDATAVMWDAMEAGTGAAAQAKL